MKIIGTQDGLGLIPLSADLDRSRSPAGHTSATIFQPERSEYTYLFDGFSIRYRWSMVSRQITENRDTQ